MSSLEPGALVADRVTVEMLGSVVNDVLFFSHEMEGNGKPLTRQNKVAAVFKTLLTEVDEARTLGGTASIEIRVLCTTVIFI